MVAPRVLAVDDDPTMLSAFRRSVSSAFAVTTALGADEAERLLAVTSFDLVISDLIAVLHRAKQLQPACKRVLLTASPESAPSGSAPCDAVLARPWMNVELRAALWSILATPP